MIGPMAGCIRDLWDLRGFRLGLAFWLLPELRPCRPRERSAALRWFPNGGRQPKASKRRAPVLRTAAGPGMGSEQLSPEGEIRNNHLKHTVARNREGHPSPNKLEYPMIQDINLDTISMETLPLGCVSKMIESDQDSDFHGLCAALMSMARTGRKDALTLLFGIAWRNRDNYPRMINFVRAVGICRHPELVDFLASELLRVPSSPASRTYLSTLLKELLHVRTEQANKLLFELKNDKRLGARYRSTIKNYLEDDELYGK